MGVCVDSRRNDYLLSFFFIRVFEAALFADHWEICVDSSDISFLFSIFVAGQAIY